MAPPVYIEGREEVVMEDPKQEYRWSVGLSAPSPPRKVARKRSMDSSEDERSGVRSSRVYSVDSSGGATVLVQSQRPREFSMDENTVLNSPGEKLKRSPPRIGVSPETKRVGRPSPVPALVGQYDFTWIESPNSLGEAKMRDSPRQHHFHGKSLLRFCDLADQKMSSFTTPHLSNITEESDSIPLFTSPSQQHHHRVSVCRTPPTEIPSPASHRKTPNQDPHMALFGILWPSSPNKRNVNQISR